MTWNCRHLANALGNLGVADYSVGNYAKAIEYQQQYLAIATQIKNRQSEWIALNNLGYALYKKGNLAKFRNLHSIFISHSLLGAIVVGLV